jgi:hypothetical protein
MNTALAIFSKKGECPMRRRWYPVVFLGSLLLTLLGSGRAPAQSLPAVLLQGRASGFGEIGIGAGMVGEFRFQFGPPAVGLPAPGQLQFIDRVNNVLVVSQQITSAFMTADQVFVEGICTVNGFLSPFQMQASVARAPGQQASFFLCYGGPFSGVCVGDFLRSGRITLDLRFHP